MSGTHLKPSQARDRKGKNSYLLELTDGFVVRIRKMDPMQMIFEGLLSLPMLRAAQKFEDIQAKFSSNDEAEKEKATEDFLKAEEKEQFLHMLRDYACKHVIEPVVVMEEDGNPDHLPVSEFELSELLAIFNSSPTRNQEVVRIAEEFRGSEPSTSGVVVPNGEDIRTTPELVAVPTERETISG